MSTHEFLDDRAALTAPAGQGGFLQDDQFMMNLDAILAEAKSLAKQQGDWSHFYREILGLRGMARRLFPTAEQMAAFEQSPHYAEIQRMLTTLRTKSANDANESEPTKVITVRLPKSLHEALRAEAFEHRTSMNKLCISKLVKFIEDEYVPEEL